MKPKILSILFNSGDSPCVNLRRDGMRSIALPEWHDGLQNPEDSPVAFLRDDLSFKAAFLSVTFTADVPSGRIQIRAREKSPVRNILGSIDEFSIEFVSTEPVTVTIPLAPRQTPGVKMHDDVWCWEKLKPTGEWTPIRTTKHRIFVLLSQPTSPWNALSANQDDWPWSEVLTHACQWARGATTTEEIAQHVERYILKAGAKRPPLLRYDIRDTNATFTDGVFDCGSFLNTLADPKIGMHKVNCSDVATIVSTFANSLGCDLQQVTLQQKKGMFLTNRAVQLGSNSLSKTGFSFGFHEVAWRNNLDESGEVFDGCFKLSPDPNAQPAKKPEGVVGMVFGSPGDGDYLDRLVRPAYRSAVQPSQLSANRPVRRIVSFGKTIRPNILKVLPEAAVTIQTDEKPAEDLFVWNFSLTGNELKGLRPVSISYPLTADGHLAVISLCERTRSKDPAYLFQVQFEIHESSEKAKDASLQRLLTLSSRLGQPKRLVTGYKVEAEDRVAIQAQLGNISILARNVGIADTDLGWIAKGVEDLFAHRNVEPANLKGVGLDLPSDYSDVRIRLPQSSVEAVWFKLFTRTGKLFRMQDELFYDPGPMNPHIVEVFSVKDGKEAGYKKLEFNLPGSPLS